MVESCDPKWAPFWGDFGLDAEGGGRNTFAGVWGQVWGVIWGRGLRPPPGGADLAPDLTPDPGKRISTATLGI